MDLLDGYLYMVKSLYQFITSYHYDSSNKKMTLLSIDRVLILLN